jgi:hypothetical protein
MEVCSSTEMGAPGASHLGTGDRGPKTDRSRPRSVPVNALISTNGVISGGSAIRTLNASFPLLELMNATTIACESTAEIMVQLWSNYGPVILSQRSETSFGSHPCRVVSVSYEQNGCCHGRGRSSTNLFLLSSNPEHFYTDS